MGLFTLLAYLVGTRAAILTLAAHPRAWIVGLVFVISAGFAREYDGEDLLHEPWHLVLPLVASLVASFLLFLVLMPGQNFTRYRSFLTLFWLTAPLAWLYAIPYERFLDPLEATKANLATLAVVAGWRVVLMIRVGVVLTGLPVATVLFRVLAYANAVLLLGLYLLPFPLIEIMGGTRLQDADSIVREAASGAACVGIILFPICLIAALIARGKASWKLEADNEVAPRPIGWPMWMLAFVSLAVWAPILPFTQPEQQLRHQVDIAFRERRIGDGLKVMSAHSLEDFPPHWEPPPRFLKGEGQGKNLDVWEEILRAPPAPWVRATYLRKLKEYVAWNRFADAERLGNLLNRMPEEEALEILAGIRVPWFRERLKLRPELMKKE